MKYFRPKSLTWWTGLFATLVGIAAIALPDDANIGEASALISMLAGGGDSSPAGLIALGLGLIGIREKLERGFQRD